VVVYEQGITYPVKVMVAEREEFKHLTHWSTFCRNTGPEGFCFLIKKEKGDRLLFKVKG